MVHGDDFITTGNREDIKWLAGRLSSRFEVKTTVIGDQAGEVKEAKVLNRVIRRTEEGWEYEADQRHGEIMVQAMGLQEGKGVTTPGEGEKPWMLEEESKPLNAAAAVGYRALAARANYLAMDRADIQYATKEVCREMSAPTTGGNRKMKRLARYLISKPRVVSSFGFQGEPGEVLGYSDSDWAGCKRTARSTSGGVLMVGEHCLKSWSSTQKSVTLSSGEAELVAAVKCCTEVLGLIQLAGDWGLDMEGRVMVDSSAAVGIATRKGNGKLRHVKVGQLWIQEKVGEEELKVEKVRGEENPADLMTKHLAAAKVEEHMKKIGQGYRTGRSEVSLRL